jgi:hypothetical protein
MQQLVDAIRTTIMLSAPYTGKVDVSYKTSGSNIYIRSKEFSMKRKSLFCLYKYFRSKDGGRWEVCGGAYPLKQWVPATSQIAKGSTGYMQSPTGPMELLGVQEGEWLRTWEAVIMRAVRSDYQCSISINNGFAGAAVRAYDLDGYN